MDQSPKGHKSVMGAGPLCEVSFLNIFSTLKIVGLYLTIGFCNVLLSFNGGCRCGRSPDLSEQPQDYQALPTQKVALLWLNGHLNFMGFMVFSCDCIF